MAAWFGRIPVYADDRSRARAVQRRDDDHADPNRRLRPTDTLMISPDDALRLRLDGGGRLRMRSRHGEAVLPVEVSDKMRKGELSSFHDPDVFLNFATSPVRDRFTQACGTQGGKERKTSRNSPDQVSVHKKFRSSARPCRLASRDISRKAPGSRSNI